MTGGKKKGENRYKYQRSGNKWRLNQARTRRQRREIRSSRCAYEMHEDTERGEIPRYAMIKFNEET